MRFKEMSIKPCETKTFEIPEFVLCWPPTAGWKFPVRLPLRELIYTSSFNVETRTKKFEV